MAMDGLNKNDYSGLRAKNEKAKKDRVAAQNKANDRNPKTI